MKLLLGVVAILFVAVLGAAAMVIGAITHLAQEVRRGTEQMMEKNRERGNQ